MQAHVCCRCSKHCRFLPTCRGLAPHIFAPYLQHYDDPKSWFAHYLRVCGRAHCICKMFDQRVMRTAFECDCTSWSCICVIFVCCFTCCWCLSRDFASAGSPPPLPPPFWCIPSRLAQDLKLAQSRNCMWSNADDQTKGHTRRSAQRFCGSEARACPAVADSNMLQGMHDTCTCTGYTADLLLIQGYSRVYFFPLGPRPMANCTWHILAQRLISPTKSCCISRTRRIISRLCTFLPASNLGHRPVSNVAIGQELQQSFLGTGICQSVTKLSEAVDPSELCSCTNSLIHR